MITLLPETNYSGAINALNEFSSEEYNALNKSMHTMVFYLNNFSGTIWVQASVLSRPDETDWFHLEEIEQEDSTQTFYKNFEGNFARIRVIGTIDGGSIRKVLIR